MAEKQCNLLKNGGDISKITKTTLQVASGKIVEQVNLCEKKDGIVTICLTLGAFAITTWSHHTLATIPTGYIPTNRLRFTVSTSSGVGGFITIETDGIIDFQPVTSGSSSGYIGFYATYPIEE